MDLAKQIKTLIKEAELYKSQGLLNESKQKFDSARKLILKNEKIKNRQNLIDAISKKIKAVEKGIDKIAKAAATPELSAKVQDLVKKLFAFSEDSNDDLAELEGAIALAKFGQYERALIEFNKLIKKDSIRVVTAKNIIKCHMELSSVEDAVDQYRQWLSSGIFTKGQSDNLRLFFEKILDKKGIDKTVLPSDEELELDEKAKIDAYTEEGEEFLDIISIGITMNNGPTKGVTVEFDVSFQSGNLISLIISGRDIKMIDDLKVGTILNDVQFFSPIAILNGKCLIAAKKKIEAGPKHGDYSVDIRIKSA